MNVSISRSLRQAAISALVFVFSIVFSASAFGKTTLSAPTLSFSNETQTTIDITVTGTAPAGAPAGFTIQWMTYSDYLANGSVFLEECDASFSGNAAASRYVLGVGQSVTVTVGNFVQDNGFSTTCAGPLICGTQYVFRVFAHANAAYNRSAFSSLYFDSTLACESTGSCTRTQGYWKNHPDSWSVDSLTLGGNTYSEAESLSILTTPDGGNGLLILAHQLIAARLSIAAGAIPPVAVASAITDADALIGSSIVPPVDGSSDFLAPGTAVTAAAGAIDDWLNLNDCDNLAQ